jgi:integrase
MSTRKSPQRQGIEERTDAKGHTRFRGTAYHERAKRHLKGPWTPNLAEARSWRIDAQARFQAGTLSAVQGPTVREAIEQFLDGIAAGAICDRSGHRYKPSTIRSYGPALRGRAVGAFGPTRLARLTRADVQLWIDSLPGAPNTVRNYVTALQALYAWAIPRGMAQVNPTRDLRLPSGETARDRIATPDEARALIAALPPKDQATLGLAFYAGLRLGEVLAMDWGHVETDRVDIVKGWDALARVYGSPKHGSVRTVPVCDELATILADHRVLMNHPSGGMLFPSERRPSQPMHPSPLRRRLYNAWDPAGMERLGFHEARHSYASMSAAAGIRLEVLSKRMGHSSIKVTYDRYHHLYRESEAEEREALNAYLRTHHRPHEGETPHE